VRLVSTLGHIEVSGLGPRGFTMPSLNRSRALLYSCAITLMLLLTTDANSARAELDPAPLLQQALRFRVTVYVNPRSGNMVAIGHCRHAAGGCDRRLDEFAHYLSEAGERNGIDPWVLAAMAFRESGLNPFAVGGVGELGILQLHPRSATSKNIRFVKDAWYRLRCKREPGACQKEVVDRAAEVLARSVVLCGGDIDLALGAYNTGRCGGNKEYARRVRREMDRLKGAVGLAGSRFGADPGATETQDPIPAPNSAPADDAAPSPPADEPVAANAEPSAAAEPSAPNEAAPTTDTSAAIDPSNDTAADTSAVVVEEPTAKANVVHTATIH
jgi:hypothetical protein